MKLICEGNLWLRLVTL